MLWIPFTIQAALMPYFSSSSPLGPLRGISGTKRRLTIMLRCSLTAQLTALPIPPAKESKVITYIKIATLVKKLKREERR